MAKERIFISHASADGPLALKLKAKLEGDFLGMIDVFVSSDKKSVGAGDKWLQKVQAALNSAAAVLVLCNKHSISSGWINFEAGAGWIKGTLVVPICHAGLTIGDLPSHFASMQAIVLEQPGGLESLYDQIAAILKLDLAPQTDFEKFLTAVAEIDANREAREGLTKITRQAEQDARLLFTELIHLLSKKRAEDRLTKLIEHISGQNSFGNPMQERVAAMRIARTREQVEFVRSRNWEMGAMTPIAYISHIFEEILKILGVGDEYLTITNLDFWSEEEVGQANFLQANINACQAGVVIHRIFIIDKKDWALRFDSGRVNQILMQHKLACGRVERTKPGAMKVKVIVVTDDDRDTSDFGHFGIARHKLADGTDDGCLVMVPRYDRRKRDAPISHLVLKFSNGGSAQDETTNDFIKKFRRAFERAEDVRTFDERPPK